MYHYIYSIVQYLQSPVLLCLYVTENVYKALERRIENHFVAAIAVLYIAPCNLKFVLALLFRSTKVCLTLEAPTVMKIKFLFTLSLLGQTFKWWE